MENIYNAKHIFEVLFLKLKKLKTLIIRLILSKFGFHKCKSLQNNQII